MGEYAIVLGVLTPAIVLALWALAGAIIPIIENVVSFF